MHFKFDFHDTRKGKLKREEYIVRVRSLADRLKLACAPMSNSDLMIQTLDVLDYDYNPVVVKLRDQIKLIWVYLHAQLMTFEIRLEQLNNLTTLTLNAFTNFKNKTNITPNKFPACVNWRG